MDLVIGAGMGGLSAAIRLARAGREVTVLEARDRAGGLAGSVELEGRHYDAGPYILLDRPGLEWAFDQLGADLGASLELIRLDEVYRVNHPSGDVVRIYRDLGRTADELEARWPGAGVAYRDFVSRMARIYGNLQPLQRRSRPGPWSLLQRGLLREGLFLLRGLQRHLAHTGLPEPVVDALGIWTHIAGQPLSEAPAPLAFVPAIVHTHGAWTVRGGVHRIALALAQVARDAGVGFRFGTRVTRIVRDGRRVLGVEADGERISADRVISNAAGVGTYAQLLDPPDRALRDQVQALPLQSPGVCAYLHVEAAGTPFLQFELPGEDAPPHQKCRVLVYPGAVDPDRVHHARLVSPTDHAWAQRAGPEGQRAYLDQALAEDWWKATLRSHEVLQTRIPVQWGQRYHLYRDSMNPVMTARFMRQGRLAHQSPAADNLFLAGSATHPGQWVSFCAISGILAADAALR